MLLGLAAGAVAAATLSATLTDCGPAAVAVVAAIRLVLLPAVTVANVVAYGLVFSVVYQGVAQRWGVALALVATLVSLAALSGPAVVLYLADSHRAVVCQEGAAPWWPF